MDVVNEGARRPRDPLILVLNPDPVSRASIYGALDREGFVVATEGSPEKGLQTITHQAPDVVLLSVDLLVGRHETLPERIRTQSPNSRIVLTASTRVENDSGMPLAEVVRGELHMGARTEE